MTAMKRSPSQQIQIPMQGKRSGFVPAGLLLAYLLASFCVMALHEPWEDELHAWILSRELGFFQLFDHMRYEGHLCLWHWILKPFSSSGAPVQALNVIGYVFCAAGILLFAEKGPFPLWMKYLFFLSFPLFYFFPAVARPYSLIPVLLWALAYFYPLRHKKRFCYGILIALMIQTHAYMEGFCAILALLYFIETVRKTRLETWRGKFRALAVFPVIGGSFLLALLQVAGAFSVCINAPELGSIFGKLTRFGEDVTHYPVEFSKYFTSTVGKTGACIAVFTLHLAGLVILFFKSKKIFLIAFCAIAYQILFSVCIYRMALQRIYLPMLILIFCFWIAFRKKEQARKNRNLKKGCIIVTVLLSVLTFPETYTYTVLDIGRPFSNIESTSRFIRQNIPPEAKILVYPPELLSGTFGAFLPDHTFISSGSGKAFRYFLYERHSWEKPSGITDETLKKFPFTREGPFYILLQAGMIREYKMDLRTLDRHFRDYQFRLIYVPRVPSFFSAGEDYLIFYVHPR